MRGFQKAAENTVFEKAVKEFVRHAKWLGPEVYQLWDDALEFLSEADEISDDSADALKKRQRLLRAAVLESAAAFEALINFLGRKLIDLDFVMTQTEKAVLLEKKVVIENGEEKERNQIYRAEERFRLLYRLASRGSKLDKATLDNLHAAFEVRDGLVHPKPGRVFDLVDQKRGFSALLGFLVAEILLAAAFGKVRKLVSPGSLPNVGAGVAVRPN